MKSTCIILLILLLLTLPAKVKGGAQKSEAANQSRVGEVRDRLGEEEA